MGQPDVIVFRGDLPLLLIELKTTNSRTNVVKSWEEFQCQMYVKALQEMGFNTSVLQLVIIKMRQQSPPIQVLPELIQYFLNRKPWSEKMSKFVAKSKMTIHSLDFDAIFGGRTLGSVLDFWNGNRDVRHTANEDRCRRCEFRPVCGKYQ